MEAVREILRTTATQLNNLAVIRIKCPVARHNWSETTLQHWEAGWNRGCPQTTSLGKKRLTLKDETWCLSESFPISYTNSAVKSRICRMTIKPSQTACCQRKSTLSCLFTPPSIYQVHIARCLEGFVSFLSTFSGQKSEIQHRGTWRRCEVYSWRDAS